jgi:hypothetical protein
MHGSLHYVVRKASIDAAAALGAATCCGSLPSVRLADAALRVTTRGFQPFDVFWGIQPLP